MKTTQFSISKYIVCLHKLCNWTGDGEIDYVFLDNVELSEDTVDKLCQLRQSLCKAGLFAPALSF